jgi:hypothetical protein
MRLAGSMGMRSSVRPLLFFALVGASLAGCATPAPVVRLEPIADNVFWVSGRPVMQLEQKGVRVAAAFEQQVRSMVGVRIEIENDTDHTLDVDPGQEFSFISCTSLSDSSCAKETFVVDPEQVIAYFDDQASREQAHAENDARAGDALVLLGAGADTLSLANRRASSAPLLTETTANDKANITSDHDRALSDLAAQRDMWSTAALRHTTLRPGDSVGGQVFIPVDRGVQTVWLRVRLGNRTFPFHFREMARSVSSQG